MRRRNDLISQLGVERVDSNSGTETRQGQKKGSRRWNQDRIKPDVTVELEPKYSKESDREGGGAERPLVCWVKGTYSCVIVYYIYIDHSHPQLETLSCSQILNWFFFFFPWSKSCSNTCWGSVLECNFGMMNPFWTLDSCIKAPPGRSVEDGVDKLFNPFTRRYFSDFSGLCRGWVRVPPMRNIGF